MEVGYSSCNFATKFFDLASTGRGRLTAEAASLTGAPWQSTCGQNQGLIGAGGWTGHNALKNIAEVCGALRSLSESRRPVAGKSGFGGCDWLILAAHAAAFGPLPFAPGACVLLHRPCCR
jgi:hypothetical protein